jgi:hypothetical protein
VIPVRPGWDHLLVGFERNRSSGLGEIAILVYHVFLTWRIFASFDGGSHMRAGLTALDSAKPTALSILKPATANRNGLKRMTSRDVIGV